MSEPHAPALDSSLIAKHLDDLAEQRRTIRNKQQRERHAIRMTEDSGYRSRRNEQQRARYSVNPEKKLAQQRAYHKLDTSARLTMSARKRAKRLKVPFDLTVGYVRQLWPADGRCPVLGYRMVLDRDLDETPSLDRIDPEGGYVMGNVRIISMRANRLKGDAHAFELRRIAAYLESPDPLHFVYSEEER